MKARTIRQWFAPALLAAAIAPLSLGAIAAPEDGDRQGWSDAYQQRQIEQRQALFERAGIDEQTRQALEDAREEHREAMMELREEHRERMNAMLDDDQRQALNEARQEMRNERFEDMRQRMNERFDAWGISAEQRQALSDSRESFYAEMQDLKDRKFDSPSERRAAWQNLRQEHYDAMTEILSAEQLQELRETMRSGMRGGMGSGMRGGMGGYFGNPWNE